MHEARPSFKELALKALPLPVLQRAARVVEIPVLAQPGLHPELRSFISKYMDPECTFTRIVNVKKRSEIEDVNDGNFYNLVNLQRINDIRFLNKFFNKINKLVPFNGVFIGCVETIELRKKRIYRKYTPVAARMFYIIDFIYKRIFPKWKPTRKFYFWLTKGRNRVISKAETLGRLISCGFEVKGYKEIDGLLYFAARNVEGPAFDPHPTYGPFVQLARVGKDGKPIQVYKLRTMHPYAEYLQSYVFKLYNLKEGGKFNNDFRVTKWGRLFRKVWLDELPMLYNWVRGDLKLVGVRPLSPHYLSLYSEEHRQRRLQYKPGLFPPYYADMPRTLEEIMDSEARYFDMYDRMRWRADVKYMWLVFVNIAIKRARSS